MMPLVEGVASKRNAVFKKPFPHSHQSFFVMPFLTDFILQKTVVFYTNQKDKSTLF
jgi:hypothetical protein